MDIKNDILWRIYAVAGALGLFAVFIMYRAITIGIVEGKTWREKGDRQHIVHRKTDAVRGNILAADGSLLATSVPYYRVSMDPLADGLTDDVFNRDIDSLAYYLATYIDNSYTPGGHRQRIVEARLAGKRYLPIKAKATHEEVEVMRNFPIFNRGRYSGGLIAEASQDRLRPFQMLAHRSIGYVRENAQAVGLEAAFDKELAGEQGMRAMKKLPGDIYLPVENLAEIEPKSGKDVVTTLDIDIQDVTQEALMRALEKHDAHHGTAIVMEVQTGAIRAIANLGRTSDDKWWETYNYAIGSPVEPGSTFKLATMLALLEDGYVDLDDSLDLENGSKQFYEETMVDAIAHGLTQTTVRRAFELSSNVGMAKLVDQYYGQPKRAERFVERLKAFGLDQITNIEIPGEQPPTIKTPYSKEEDWSGTTLPWMSIGYELTLTPLQLLTFYNAVANDGQMMKPYIVSEIQQYGQTLKRFKPTVVKKRIASPKALGEVRELLQSVVTSGTASSLQSPYYNFAGKTGTAQLNYNRRGQSMSYQASFAGYFPAEAPKYSIIVVISSPKQNGLYGGEVAGPVFREIADRIYGRQVSLHASLNEQMPPPLHSYQMPSNDAGAREDMEKVLGYLGLPVVYADDDSPWAVLVAERDTLSLLPRKLRDDLVPNVTGMGLRDAIYLLENKGLRVNAKGRGRVRSQSIRPGTKVRGQDIDLVLN